MQKKKTSWFTLMEIRKRGEGGAKVKTLDTFLLRGHVSFLVVIEAGGIATKKQACLTPHIFSWVFTTLWYPWYIQASISSTDRSTHQLRLPDQLHRHRIPTFDFLLTSWNGHSHSLEPHFPELELTHPLLLFSIVHHIFYGHQNLLDCNGMFLMTARPLSLETRVSNPPKNNWTEINALCLNLIF